jgi:hypothetical protein
VFETAFLTDNARAILKAAFRGQHVSNERDVIAALTKRNRGVAMYLLAKAGQSELVLPASGSAIERGLLLKEARKVAKQRNANHIGTEHLIIAIAGIPNSGLVAKGLSPERLNALLSESQAEWAKAHRPISRRVGTWVRSVILWARRGA